jgi:hypothetical protein
VREIVRTARDRTMKVAVMCTKSETARAAGGVRVLGPLLPAPGIYICVCVACMHIYTTFGPKSRCARFRTLIMWWWWWWWWWSEK